jgi:hypothetical protein
MAPINRLATAARWKTPLNMSLSVPQEGSFAVIWITRTRFKAVL